MEFVIANWGSLTSAIGVIVSLVGLGWAIKEARGARTASQAAYQAARETSERIARYRRAVNLERAIALIQRIKLLHNIGRWEAALEQYQALRVMLSDIIGRSPEAETELLERLANARAVVRSMESVVERRVSQGPYIDEPYSLNQTLNRIQSDLEALASTTGFGDSREEME